MAAPQVIAEKVISLIDVKSILQEIEKRDGEFNYISSRVKEFLENFTLLPAEKKQELRQKLTGLKLTRLKEEQIMKIIDFLPATTEDLKVLLQAYPLSMSQKDQEAIIKVVREFKQ